VETRLPNVLCYRQQENNLKKRSLCHTDSCKNSHLHNVSGEVEESWQWAVSHIDFSIDKQILKPHLNCWLLYTHSAQRKTKICKAEIDMAGLTTMSLEIQGSTSRRRSLKKTSLIEAGKVWCLLLQLWNYDFRWSITVNLIVTSPGSCPISGNSQTGISAAIQTLENF
jgi:hypothetical protein